MNLVNPYRFGGLNAPNVFIGGVGATSVTSIAAFVTKTTGITAGNVSNFTIDSNNNVSLHVNASYGVANSAFQNDTAITYYIDLERCTSVGDNSLRSDAAVSILKFVYIKNAASIGIDSMSSNENLMIVILPSVTNIGSFVNSGLSFRFNNVLRIVCAPACASLGQTSGDNFIFTSSLNIEKVYVDDLLATNNAGSPDGDITYLTGTVGASVGYATNLTPPDDITDLAVVDFGGSYIEVSWTAPTSTNAIDYYVVLVNNVFYSLITTTTEIIRGLEASSDYEIKVLVIDAMGNSSGFVSVSQTTASTYNIPTANIVSYWPVNSNSLDAVGSNDGTDTSISYVAGKISNAASFNGTTSIIKCTGFNTGFNAVDFSVSTWFKTTQTTAFRLVQNRGQGAGLSGWQISQSNNINWGNIAISDGVNVILMDNITYNEDDNLWHNIIMTWNTTTGTCKIYIDGVYRGEKTDINLIGANLNGLDVCMGGSNTNGQLFNGLQDEISIFNIELSYEEVSEINAKANAGFALTA